MTDELVDLPLVSLVGRNEFPASLLRIPCLARTNSLPDRISFERLSPPKPETGLRRLPPPPGHDSVKFTW